ncbi:MAG: type II secretion system protein [Kiritimatiellia bacterium]|nr:type II secretion system protein [Kiritimatiellia bacterium]
MRTMWKKKMGHAFTLVELLVVIAIIGILAGIVLPQVNNALFRARVTEISIRGKSIVQTMFAKDTESIYTTTGAGWPKKGGSTVVDTWTFATSTDFFRNMVTGGLMSVNFQYFAGPGIPGAGSSDAFKPENNAWVLVAGITDAYPETAPAVLTRNLDMANRISDVIVESGKVKLDDTRKPFGEKGFAFATKGGAGFAIMGDDLKPQNFTNVFVRADARGQSLTNEVIRPGESY